MRLSTLRKEFEEIKEMTLELVSSKFETWRDEKGYLNVKRGNQETIKLPLIPLRGYQEKAQIKLYVDGIKRLFYVWPRRSGKEVISWNDLITGAIERPGLYGIFYPTNVRARMVLWEGAISMPDGSSIRFLDMIPKEYISSINNQDMSIKLVNGSVIRTMGLDVDPDKLRGINVLGAVLSEFAFSDPRILHILMPILTQNGGWLMIQTTYNGMNHAYRLMQDVKGDPEWHCVEESVESLLDENGNRYITDEMIDKDRRSGMPEFMIQQEYYSVVQINQETLYFAREITYLDENEKIVPGLFVPNSQVYTGWDIGINDSTAIIMFQIDKSGHPVLINYIESNNKNLEYYIQECRRFCTRHNFVLSAHYIPHDGQKRDFNTGKNTVDYGRELGETFYVVPKPTSKINAIQSMRQMLYRVKLNKENTGRFIECLSNYSKEFDAKGGVYKNEPLHNWASHGVDAFQTLTLAMDAGMINEVNHEVIYMQL